MTRQRISRLPIVVASFFILLGLSVGGFAQGKGKGNSGGKGSSNSQKAAKDKSNGKSDSTGTITVDNNSTGVVTANDGKGKGKSGKSKGNANRFNGLSKKTGASPEALDAWYERERLANPNLNHGRFTAAQMVGRNHNIPPQAILDGMRNGDSMGQVLRRRGLTDAQIDVERKKIREIVDKDKNGFPDYVDDDNDWNVDKNDNKGKGKNNK